MVKNYWLDLSAASCRMIVADLSIPVIIEGGLTFDPLDPQQEKITILINEISNSLDFTEFLTAVQDMDACQIQLFTRSGLLMEAWWLKVKSLATSFSSTRYNCWIEASFEFDILNLFFLGIDP